MINSAALMVTTYYWLYCYVLLDKAEFGERARPDKINGKTKCGEDG